MKKLSELSQAPLSAVTRIRLKAALANLAETARNKQRTLDPHEHQRELAAGREFFELGCWLYFYHQRIGLEGLEGLANRIDCARRIFEAGFTNPGYQFFTAFDFGERQFDTLFEMGDSQEVIDGLRALLPNDASGNLRHAFDYFGWPVDAPVSVDPMASAVGVFNAFQRTVLAVYDGGDHLVQSPLDSLECGDGLLRFLLVELSDSEDCDNVFTAISRVETAIAQLSIVLTALQTSAQKVEDKPQFSKFELVLTGFDGGTDATDHLVLGVKVESADILQQFIETSGLGEAINGFSPLPFDYDAIDFTLPEQADLLKARIVELVSTERGEA